MILIGRRNCLAVDSSWMFIWIDPFTGDDSNGRIRVGELRTHRVRQADAHGAEAAGVEANDAARQTGSTAPPTSGAGRRRVTMAAPVIS